MLVNTGSSWLSVDSAGFCLYGACREAACEYVPMFSNDRLPGDTDRRIAIGCSRGMSRPG